MKAKTKRTRKRKCCKCKGHKAPSFRCECNCHEGEGIKFWEEIAYTWIFDAVDREQMLELWLRFLEAYPGVTKENLEEFLERFEHSPWWEKHHHHFHKHHHHHHEYC